MAEVKEYTGLNQLHEKVNEASDDYAKSKREEAMARFMAAKARKKEIIAELEVEMKADYEKRTGLKAKYFSAL